MVASLVGRQRELAGGASPEETWLWSIGLLRVEYDVGLARLWHEHISNDEYVVV